MQPYDVFMLIVLVGTTAFGAWKGMAWQLASFASLVVSGGVAVHGSPVIAPMLTAQAPWNRFLAMLILFLVTSFAIWIVFRFVAKVIDRIQLKEFDRQMGALFGLLKGIALCLVLTFFAVTLSERTRLAVLDSRSGYYTAKLIEHAGPLLPEEVRSVIGEYVDELERQHHPEGMESAKESAIVGEKEESLLDGELDSRWEQAKQAAEGGSRFFDEARDTIENAQSGFRRVGDEARKTIDEFQDSLERGGSGGMDLMDRGRGAMERVQREFDAWKAQSEDTFR